MNNTDVKSHFLDDQYEDEFDQDSSEQNDIQQDNDSDIIIQEAQNSLN